MSVLNLYRQPPNVPEWQGRSLEKAAVAVGLSAIAMSGFWRPLTADATAALERSEHPPLEKVEVADAQSDFGYGFEAERTLLEELSVPSENAEKYPLTQDTRNLAASVKSRSGMPVSDTYLRLSGSSAGRPWQRVVAVIDGEFSFDEPLEEGPSDAIIEVEVLGSEYGVIEPQQVTWGESCAFTVYPERELAVVVYNTKTGAVIHDYSLQCFPLPQGGKILPTDPLHSQPRHLEQFGEQANLGLSGEGPFALYVRKDGYWPSAKIEVLSNQRARLEVFLTPLVLSNIRLIWSDTHEPVVGAGIEVLSSANDIAVSAAAFDDSLLASGRPTTLFDVRRIFKRLTNLEGEALVPLPESLPTENVALRISGANAKPRVINIPSALISFGDAQEFMLERGASIRIALQGSQSFSKHSDLEIMVQAQLALVMRSSGSSVNPDSLQERVITRAVCAGKSVEFSGLEPGIYEVMLKSQKENSIEVLQSLGWISIDSGDCGELTLSI